MMIILCYMLHFGPTLAETEVSCHLTVNRSAHHAVVEFLRRTPETTHQWDVVWHETPAANLAIIHYEREEDTND